MAKEGRKRSQGKKNINAITLASKKKQLKRSKYRDEDTRATLDKRVQDIYAMSADRDRAELEHCQSSEQAIQGLEKGFQAL